MMRIQIQLEPAQHRQLRRRARFLGVSVSEIVRRSIAASLKEDAEGEWAERVRRARSAVGKFQDPSGARHIAAKHDDALAEAYRK